MVWGKTEEFYDGQWVKGLKQGYGMWRGPKGQKNEQPDEYIGEWLDNKPNGFGKHTWGNNGDVYEGEWKYCLRHGQGADRFSVGDFYIGEYRFGKDDGYGQYNWANGNQYSGQFYNGMKHGQGSWKKTGDENSNKYEGKY